MLASDIAGLAGALLILAAYAGVQLKRLDPHRAGALFMNLSGAGLVMVSLLWKFNLAAFLLEAAWAVVALGGLLRLVFARARPH